jgi:hypothetical protein
MKMPPHWYRPYPWWIRDRLKLIPVLLVLNALVAIIGTLLDGIGNLGQNLLIANAIGFSMWIMNSTINWATHGRLANWPVLITTPLGVFIGFKLAMMMGADDVLGWLAQDPRQRWRPIVLVALLSVSSVGFFLIFLRGMTYRMALEGEQRQAAEARQAETSAKLSLLQAQIEPHFLFNTLANIQSLIERDPATSKAMLQHLNHYLRVSLGRTRKPVSTLEEELDLVQTLLAIAAIRLGPRLHYTIDASEALRRARLPPLLLQPLVENALEHGIEPAVAGGEIRIEADQSGDALRLRVVDNGVGLLATAEDGVGLSNVRARLSSLYGERGRLALYTNQPCGVIAELILPLQTI